MTKPNDEAMSDTDEASPVEGVVMCPQHHEPETMCDVCGEIADKYGNTVCDFRNCCFPDCGCDGARNCSAPSGANICSFSLNRERKT